MKTFCFSFADEIIDTQFTVGGNFEGRESVAAGGPNCNAQLRLGRRLSHRLHFHLHRPPLHHLVPSSTLKITLLTWSTSPFLIHKVPLPKGSNFWLPVIQVFASLNLLLSIVEALTTHEITYFSSPDSVALDCWGCTTNVLVIHIARPLNDRCHMRIQWTIPVVCFHALYVAALVGLTGAIRHIEFRFHELKDLWRGILMSTSSIGIWVVAYVLNETHDDIEELQVASRFLLLTMASIYVLAFFSISSSQPLVSQMSLRKKDGPDFETMGQALGIPDSGLLVQRESTQVIDPKEPLDKLLPNKRFRQSFMAFADSCLAGESVHFYEEVHELNKIRVDDTVRRLYMARHIIEKYIVPGSTMEVNISHRSRQDILSTADLAQPDLFRNALNELVQLMIMNLAKDYWSSTFFLKFKEADMWAIDHDLEQATTGWNFSPRLSSVHGIDDPFHQDQPSKDSTMTLGLSNNSTSSLCSSGYNY
ncbi:hypothetical protein RHGRI_034242 [Rhododendron griersonianum]|uniref:RGS domain-containing protein n=1 Tax=Rhododendron griersonianum TaxID=479676 RepID=A0AAV6I4B4_9ERIC|nr:hypothetical protein RHGRI_034242 [Rhododendron griersonianum]